MRKLLAIFILLLFAVAGSAVWFNFFDSTGSSSQSEIFIVPQNTENSDAVTSLYSQKFIKNTFAFKFLLDYFSSSHGVNPGGYTLSRNMNAWQVMKKVTGNPDLIWFKSSFCIRKEQVGEYLADALKWDSTKLDQWNSLYKSGNTDYFEGVYYPDTYLIPVTESPSQVAQRFINNFNEKVGPILPEFAAKNIKWTTGLKIASLIARESGGPGDMKLISGIIWNRLDKGMPLQIDSTMQYTLGKNANGSWWGSIDLAQKQSDSPYNSYLYKGLPPTPICSPSEDAIEAAANPETTDCLYYLHGLDRQIHCAATYQEHLSNIEKYLKI